MMTQATAMVHMYTAHNQYCSECVGKGWSPLTHCNDDPGDSYGPHVHCTQPVLQ